MTLRLWIDTDVGDDPDDAVALLAAAAHPGVELVGVSTVGGDVRARAEAARRVLDSVGADVLLFAGPPRPEALAAADALLAIGPLTNLGRLLDAGFALPPVAAMGGALRPVQHRGATRVVEHNVGADPGAAATVVERADDLLLVPLDVTRHLRLTAAELDALLAAAPVLGPEVERWRAGPCVGGAPAPVCLHDPLALLAVLGEPGIGIERRRLRVLPDGRVRADGTEGRWHDVVVDVDRAVAVARVLELLAGSGA